MLQGYSLPLYNKTNKAMKLEHGSYLEFGNELGKEELQLLHFFCIDTTERILRNVAKLNIRNTGALASSIHGIVYANSGRNDAMIRFYYMNYAGYLENALGSYFDIDDDLSKGNKRHGVKAKNAIVPQVDSQGVRPMEIGIKGIPEKVSDSRAHQGQMRGALHRAKPIIHSEIRLHLKNTQRRLAVLLGYTATAYLLRGLIVAIQDKGMVEHEYPYGIGTREQWLPTDFSAAKAEEDAWLEARGYLKQIEHGWGLTAFAKGVEKL